MNLIWNLLRSKKGFTLIEVSVVIAVLGILASIGVIKYQDNAENARVAVVRNTVNEVNRFLQATAARDGQYPASLDSAPAGNVSAGTPFFDTVGYPVARDWSKRTGNIYQPTNLQQNTLVYQYDASAGLFREVSNNYVNPPGTRTLLNSFLASSSLKQFASASTSNDGKSWYYDQESLGDDAVYTPWSGSGRPLEFNTNFASAGDYTLSFSVMNYATHGEAGRDSSWKMPAGYKFNFDVYVDGKKVNPTTISVSGSDTQFNTGSVNLTGITQGSHKIGLVWTNDSYNASSHLDANAMIKDIVIQ